MSRETTEARFAASPADQAWREHRRDCPRCAAAIRARHWDQLCDRGFELRQDMHDANRKLKRNRELDKLPSPDQQPLFTL